MQVATETVSAASFDGFPDQVLESVFRHFKFPDILPLSTVSHRWNRLVFRACSDQLVFRPAQSEGLCGDRTYRHVDLSRCGLPVPAKRHDDDDAVKCQLELLASEATSLAMTWTAPWFAELLLRVLRNFPKIVELRWQVSGDVRSVWATGEVFQEELERLPSLPRIRELSLVVNDTRMIDLLEKVSPNVVSLEVTVELGPMLTGLTFADFDLSKLRTCKLLVTGATLEQDDQQAGNDIHLLCKRLQNLRKLTVGINNCYCQSAVSSSHVRIQELELVNCQECDLGHLRDLPCLQIFRTDALAVFTDTEMMDLFNPIHMVSTIDIDQALHVDIDRLALMFPCLRVFRARSYADGWTSNNLHNLCSILDDLEELALPAGPDEATLQQVLAQIGRNLCKLRDLTLVGCVLTTPDFRLFGPILKKPSLRKLTIESETVRASGIPPAAYVLPAWNATQTELVINGARVQVVGV
ncbi:uncharacterized protein LOC119771096 [Culex quinquefasciatus]|uniref:uncharacterized protein LOC119771096 n=1 Tax=Culex quinquefasciatus TaxID=7176 RepID=UPI0018E2AB49|nr:uncharacterized protein LOC119771096 [Culex quinquefasciatus]